MAEKSHYIKLGRGRVISKQKKKRTKVMNLPEPISYFMTSSCRSCLSISQQAINIKMKFFCMSYQKLPISIAFTNVFSCKQRIPLHQSFIKSNLVLISVLSEKLLSPLCCSLFFFPLSWQKVHEYHFTLDCGCISIDQEIKSKPEGYVMTLQSSKQQKHM